MGENEEKKKTKPDRREFLTKTPVPRLIISLSIPTIISMLVTGIYNSADTYFVGRISTQATAAVGLVFSLMALIQAIGFFCGHGSGNYLSRMLGAGNHKEANEVAATGFAMALILGCTVAVLGNLFADPLAVAIGAGETTLQDTMIYMRIILLGAPFMMGQFVINNQLRFQGSAMYAMIGLMCGAVVNLILDPFLILGLHLGTAGAAIATVSGQIISFIVLLIGSRKGQNIRLKVSNVRLNGHFIKEIINGGIPSLFRQGLAAISTLLLNHMAGRFGGDAAIAGMSVTTRVLMMMASAMIGFGQGFQPVCSYNYGAGLKQRVREGFFFCVRWGTLFLACLSAASFCFAPSIIRWFREDPLVVEVGTVALRAQALTMPLLATTTMINMMLQSIGKGVKASITASARNGIFFLPMILFLPQILGLTGVEIAQAVADVLSLALAIPLGVSELRMMKKNTKRGG
ncbi:MAG: MATE family efflux transporter [Lachnospiraceae bacterium]|nr:MATE family efflux transporter [Lachnospiraceae bacterium]